MLINFCHPHLNPSISCDNICCDGYEVNNLLAINSSQKKGFLADYFLKPPITVTVQFMCNINLSHIIIYPRVGAQKSIGFEIYASKNLNDCIDEKQLIGRGYIRNSEDCIVFSKRQMRDFSDFISIPFSHHFFITTAKHFRKNARNISIKITKTSASSVPSLKAIEIWGEPSFSCELNLKEYVFNLWRTTFKKIVNEKIGCSKQSLEAESHITVRDEKELSIPEEFLDLITYDIMALPMLLPSGKVIDQSTLEKCAKVDAQSGRTPSDPFTGEIFTEHRRPIFSAFLKAKIDKFLSENALHPSLCNTSRTVGKRKSSSNNVAINKICKIVSPNNTSSPSINYQKQKNDGAIFNSNFSGESASLDHFKVSDSAASHSKNSNSALEQNLPSMSSIKNLNNDNSVSDIICIDDSDSDEVIDLSDDSQSSNQVSTKLNVWASHDVNEILQKTLAALPSFTQGAKSQRCKEVTNQVKCITCCNVDNLYKLVCSHLLCRGCLLSNTSNLKVFCSICSKEFPSKAIDRYHP